MHARVSIAPAFTVAPVNRRLFGSFVEHMGRCVYSGIYEPGHPTADEDGFRGDVLELVKEQGVTMVRYPGGNFVSGYRWEDGVGPREERPVRLDPAWRTIETNAFGLGEFMAWSRKADVEPMMAVNLGTRGLSEALDLLEYANHPSGTYLSDLRVSHGSPEPYDIRTWCLGNEMDGDWQLGYRTAEEYGHLAARTARAMRQHDAGLDLVACGSSARGMATFGYWESTVLEHTYDAVDMISAHAYYELEGDDVASFLASSVDMDRFIKDVVAAADHVGSRLKSDHRVSISFDEWNVWYMKAMHAGGLPDDWTEAPPISEDPFTALDAVVVGSLLITLLRHADRVSAACQAQLVNTIGSIRTEPGGPAWRMPTFHPFAETARHARGTVLQTQVDAPSVPTTKHGAVPVLDAVATHDAETGELVVFCVNRDPHDPLTVDVDVRPFGDVVLTGSTVLAEEDLFATNTAADPGRVAPRENPDAALDGGLLRVTMPRASWGMIRMQVA